MSLEPYPGEGVGPVHSREVPLPLTRDYFEALTLMAPASASNAANSHNDSGGIEFTGVEVEVVTRKTRYRVDSFIML